MSEHHEQIRNLLGRYCELMDAADWHGVGALFAHARLTERMNGDALDAHAAGHIFAVVLGERIEGVADLANELRLPSEPPHPRGSAAAAILRRYPTAVGAD